MKPHRQRAMPCALALVLSAALASATTQGAQPAKKAPAAQSPDGAVRVTTRLVLVNVIVQNSKGEPIEGLSKEDFAVYDRGQVQEVATFSVLNSQGGGAAATAAPAVPNQFSNRLEQRSNAPTSATVILLDELNTAILDSTIARQEAVKLLRQIQPNDRVALYVLRSNLKILHDFTRDAALLLKALDRHRSTDSAVLSAANPEPPDTGNPELDAWLEGANERMGDYYNTHRANLTLGAMEAIARHLARVPGRKNLIWISGSFPISIGLDREQIQGSLTRNRQTYSQEVEQAGRVMSDANIAIYPVDARGLMTTFSQSPNFNRPMYATGRSRIAPLDQGMGAITDTHHTMNMLADRTGGRAFYNTNDIQGSIRKAINDARVNYVLGFYPTHQKWDGNFRPLKVEVKRAGVQLRFRKGYVAAGEQPVTPETARAAIRDAALAPLDAAEIGLTIDAKPVSAAGVDTVMAALRIETRDLTLVRQGERRIGALDLLFLLRAADGTAVSNVTHRMNLNLRQQAYQEALQRGVIASKHLFVPAHAVELRIVVRDVASGGLGSVSIPVQRVLHPSPAANATQPR